MSVIEEMRQAYAPAYEVAKELGWNVDERDMLNNGPRFLKPWSLKLPHTAKEITGVVYLWKGGDGWVCADMGMSGYFKNHRKYPSAIEGMRQEHAQDIVVEEVIAEVLKEEPGKAADV